MICKYCGAQYTGNRCASCGKVIPLVKRSTNLEQLMAGMNNPSENEAPRAKTFEQGLKEGYQKGLKEGYNNGYAEGKDHAVRIRQPVAKKHYGIMAFAAVAIFLAAVSGLLFGKIGFNNGYKQGMDSGIAKGTEEGSQTATELMKAQINEQYNAGYEQGQSEGYNTGFEAGKNEGYQLGYDTAKNENVNNGAQASQDPKATPGPQTVSEAEFPYSRERNGNSYNSIVEKIQARLKELGYRNGKKEIATDGIYGPNTEKAVKAFQEESGLPVSGNVDTDTYKRLFPDETVSENHETDAQDNHDGQEDDSDRLTPDKQVEEINPFDPLLPAEKPTPANPSSVNPTGDVPFSLILTPGPKNKLPVIPETNDGNTPETKPRTTDSLLF